MSDFSVILIFMALFVTSMVSFSFMIRSVQQINADFVCMKYFVHVYFKMYRAG